MTLQQDERDDEMFWLRVQDRAELRRMPSSIRRVLGRARTAYHRGHLLLETRDDVRARAEGEGHVRTVEDFPFSVEYVPAIFQRRILRQLGSDRRYIAHLGNRVRDRLRQANVTRATAAGARGMPTRLPDCRPLKDVDTWAARSDLGLGTCTVLEALPDAFAIGIAQEAWDRWNGLLAEDLGIDDERTALRALVVGSFPGTVTLALAAAAPASARLEVYEVDTVGEATALGVVIEFADRTSALSTNEPFDLIVMAVPPASQNAQYRGRYVAEASTSRAPNTPRAFDMGALGLRRWRKALAHRFAALAGRLAPHGELVVVMPESVRVPLGYEPAPPDDTDLRHLFEVCGFVITRQLVLTEVDPPPQPFVAERRPERRCLFAAIAVSHDATAGREL